MKTMQEIADLAQLTFDGGTDTRLFADDNFNIDVFAPALGAVSYRKMEKKIKDYKIQREKYCVYVWNDCSGYQYWKNEGGCNYIKVTANIVNTDLSLVEISQLKQDIQSAYDEFCEFHNLDAYIETLGKKRA